MATQSGFLSRHQNARGHLLELHMGRICVNCYIVFNIVILVFFPAVTYFLSRPILCLPLPWGMGGRQAPGTSLLAERVAELLGANMAAQLPTIF